MKFPHLEDSTSFPRADTRVYGQYVNTYDYHIWTPNTKIKLCNVKWRDDGHDTVKFADDKTRDAWFDMLDGETVTLTSSMYIARADTDGVKIPVPYMTAQRYNYIVVDYTSEILQSPLQHADCQTRYHYFVTQLTAEAPNTTTVVLRRDVWTDYINTTTITGLLLERGHAPLVETTPEKLLENPRENSVELLAPDVNYGGAANRITDIKATGLTGGERYVCLACAFGTIGLETMAHTRGADIAATDPVYGADDGTVTSWTWDTAGIDVSGCRTLGTPYASQRGRTPNNWTVFALRASDVTDKYINDLFAYYPHITAGIGACFVVTADMCARGAGAPVMVDGVAWMPVMDTERTLGDITLTPADFDMPPEVADVAKLYVSPYSVLEITDTWGKKATINIEDCGRLSVRTLVSVAYPLVRQVAYLDGYGADGTTTIAVNNLTGETVSGHLPNSDALATLISYDIPTYALQRRNIDAYRGANYNTTVMQARKSAIAAYENTAQAANTAQANTHRSNNTMRSNTARANTAQATNTARGNTLRTDVKNLNNTAADDMLKYTQTQMDDDLTSVNTKILSDAVEDQSVAQATFNAGVTQNALSNVSSMVANVSGAIVGVAASGAATAATGGAAAPFAIGAMSTLATTGINVGLSGYNSALAITNQKTIFDASNTALFNKAELARTQNREVKSHAEFFAVQQTTRQQKLATDITNTSNQASTDMTANSTTASNANATATTDTGNANADSTRAQTIGNAKRSMLTTRDGTTNMYRDMYNQPPSPIGAYTGDSWADEMAQRAYTIKVRTQTKGALLQAGMYMLRYGIACNKIYNMPNLIPCRHYTYWRAADVWLTNTHVDNGSLDAIRDRLTAGVTIWSNPDEIGDDYLTENIN